MNERPDPVNTTQKWAVYQTLPNNERVIKLVSENKQDCENYAKSIAGIVEPFETADVPVDQSQIPDFKQVNQ